MYTTRSTIISTFLAATAVPACTEWNIEVTTMGGDTALTTIVTAGVSDDEGGESTDVGADTDTASEVTTDPTTGEGTISGSETTVAQEAISDPPIGCAFLVELNIGGDPNRRHVVIDASDCDPRATLSLSLDTFDDSPFFDMDLGPRVECSSYGAQMSVAAIDGGMTFEAFGPATEVTSAFAISLFVDGAVSDNVRVPAILQGQTWDDMPGVPQTPLRRTTNWAWFVTDVHTPTCDLIDA